MSSLNTQSWTVVMRQPIKSSEWFTEPGHNKHQLVNDAYNDKIILMHRKAGEGWEAVARLPGPYWRRMVDRKKRLA